MCPVQEVQHGARPALLARADLDQHQLPRPQRAGPLPLRDRRPLGGQGVRGARWPQAGLAGQPGIAVLEPGVPV